MRIIEKIAVVSGALGAVFMVVIALTILLQIGSRLAGVHIPSLDDLAIWSMAASVFLALPYAMLHEDHIRVTVVKQMVPSRGQRGYELFATLIALMFTAWGAWVAAEFVYESYIYNELASGILPIPMWIPQFTMPLGLTLLAMMLGRRLVLIMQNKLKEVSHD